MIKAKFAKYINEDSNIFYNIAEELLYDRKLETITGKELIDKFIESIKENLNDLCYQEVT